VHSYHNGRDAVTILTFLPPTYAMASGWFGGGWFGGQKTRDTPKKAILGLRSQLEMLSKREKHLESQIDDQDNLARKHVSSNKNGMFSCDTRGRRLYDWERTGRFE
jgi:hypothetical protein